MLKEVEQKSFQQICSIKILIQIFSHLWSAVANIKIVILRKKMEKKSYHGLYKTTDCKNRALIQIYFYRKNW